ncbi:endonuclease [Caulobacter sp. NIBR2454]|uniref:endonuclease n=1 Tax=Caulobacter sp. NIBR2454 TaxID=3015996 RepID=UPI0022B67252|nr:endonuclease [Caulobacter sp. NIBR2454]
MAYLAAVTLASALATASAAIPTETPSSLQGPVAQIVAQSALETQAVPEPEVMSTEISVLTYNVKGLPWPIAKGRAQALREIGEELAQMRREGRQPQVVLIQEGFRDEVEDLVATSGYPHWARGPGRSERAVGPQPEDAKGFDPIRYLRSGEGWGKLTGAGLHVLSDLPILEVVNAPYRYCAGFDCLANKGVMMVRLALPDGPGEIDIINTHMNSRRAAKVPMERSLQAHRLQTDELLGFIRTHWTADRPLLVGGDFNVKNAPDRYAHRADARPYKVVAEFCGQRDSGCQGEVVAADAQPWLRSQDLQAFVSKGPIDVRPIRIDTLFGFDGIKAPLSDHDGYLVRYRLSWNPTVLALARNVGPVEVRPQFRNPGLRVSVKY